METQTGVQTEQVRYRLAVRAGPADGGARWTLRPGSYAAPEQAEVAALVAMQEPATLAVILEEVDGDVRAPAWLRLREDLRDDLRDAAAPAGAEGVPPHG